MSYNNDHGKISTYYSRMLGVILVVKLISLVAEKHILGKMI